MIARSGAPLPGETCALPVLVLAPRTLHVASTEPSEKYADGSPRRGFSSSDVPGRCSGRAKKESQKPDEASPTRTATTRQHNDCHAGA